MFGGSLQDNNHLEREYSLSSYDIPHNLVIGYGLDLPFGRGKHIVGGAEGIVNGIVSGWRINGITTFRSGVPIAVAPTFAGSALSQLGGGQGYFGTGGQWMRPDVVPVATKAARVRVNTEQIMAGLTRRASSLWTRPPWCDSATPRESIPTCVRIS